MATMDIIFSCENESPICGMATDGEYRLIVDGEWYASGTYEQMDDMMRNIRMCELEEEEARCSEPESDYYGD